MVNIYLSATGGVKKRESHETDKEPRFQSWHCCKQQFDFDRHFEMIDAAFYDWLINGTD
jgi:hypothetical protein